MKKVYKPLAPVHRFYFILYISVFALFDIAAFCGNFDPLLFWIVLIYNGTVCIAYFLVRVLYNVKYVIDDNYVYKKRGRKVLFKIKICDLEAIYVKKAKWHSYFAFVFDAFVNEGAKRAHSSSISFVYYNCDLTTSEISELSRESLRDQKLRDAFEQNEIFSYRQCKKICEAIVEVDNSIRGVIFEI